MSNNDNDKKCSKCRLLKKSKEYYIAASNIINSDGRLGICKECLESLVDFNDKTTLINVLRMIDRPYLSQVYDSAKNSKAKNLFGEYMRLLGMRHNRELTYADSNFKQNLDLEKISQEDTVFSKEDLEYFNVFWGKGYSNEDYEFLQNEYEKFISSYEVDSYALELFFQEASQVRLTIKKKRERGESVDKELKTLQELLGSANVKPVQETGANATDQASFGTLIKKYENERPVPDPDPQWKDPDKIKKYVNVWFLGHLSRMLGLKNKTAKQYEEEINKYTVKNPDYEEDE